MRKPENLVIKRINKEKTNIFINLAQAYEAEFSGLTHNLPDKKGVFQIDSLPSSPYTGYLAYFQQIPVGFCIINTKNSIKEVSEFYVIPAMRRKKIGYLLATTVFNKHPGNWQVRQIKGAGSAKKFWRSVISKYTKKRYMESSQNDDRWGVVSQQSFKTNPRKKRSANR